MVKPFKWPWFSKSCRKSKASSSTRVEGNLLSHGFDLPPVNLTTHFSSSSSTFPQPSAVPTTWKSHTICSSYATRLLTDGLPSMLPISLRLVRSGRTTLLHQTLLRDPKKVTNTFISLKKKKKSRYNFIPLILKVKTDKVFREAALFQRETQIQAWERWCTSPPDFYKRRVPTPPPSLHEHSNETLSVPHV